MTECPKCHRRYNESQMKQHLEDSRVCRNTVAANELRRTYPTITQDEINSLIRKAYPQ
jgi:hypothetical protein